MPKPHGLQTLPPVDPPRPDGVSPAPVGTLTQQMAKQPARPLRPNTTGKPQPLPKGH